jgi:hypothetical protein
MSTGSADGLTLATTDMSSVARLDVHQNASNPPSNFQAPLLAGGIGMVSGPDSQRLVGIRQHVVIAVANTQVGEPIRVGSSFAQGLSLNSR